MRIYIPTPLRSYTGGSASVEAEGSTLAELFAQLDREYPGIRFRVVDEQDQIRRHIKIFVNQEVAGGLAFPLRKDAAVHIVMAISGGADH